MAEKTRIGDQLGLWDVRSEMPVVARQGRRTSMPGERPVEPVARLSGGPGEPRAMWGIDDVAAFLGVPKQTIYSWRQSGYGPKAIRVGKHLRWRSSVVIEWTLRQEQEG